MKLKCLSQINKIEEYVYNFKLTAFHEVHMKVKCDTYMKKST